MTSGARRICHTTVGVLVLPHIPTLPRPSGHRSSWRRIDQVAVRVPILSSSSFVCLGYHGVGSRRLGQVAVSVHVLTLPSTFLVCPGVGSRRLG